MAHWHLTIYNQRTQTWEIDTAHESREDAQRYLFVHGKVTLGAVCDLNTRNVIRVKRDKWNRARIVRISAQAAPCENPDCRLEPETKITWG